MFSGAAGVALLWLALRAWRRGRLELPIGESALQLLRGSVRFGLAMVLLVAASALLLAFSVVEGRRQLAPDGGAMQPFAGDGFTIDVPERWDAAPELMDTNMQQAGFAGVAFSRRDEELVVMWPQAPTAVALADATPADVAGALTGLALSMRSPVIRYSEWKVVGGERSIDIRMRYPAPRGDVVGRIVAAIDNQHHLRSYHAVCSHQGEHSDCERIVDSLELTLPPADMMPVGPLPAATTSAKPELE